MLFNDFYTGDVERFTACITRVPPYVDVTLEKRVIAQLLTEWVSYDGEATEVDVVRGRTSLDDYLPGPSLWRTVFESLLPGASILAITSPRTYDLTATALRLAKFEVRDMFLWGHGSDQDLAATTPYRPHWTPVVIAMKPREGTYIENALKHQVAGYWIDGGKVPENYRAFFDAPAKRGYDAEREIGRWPFNFVLTHHAKCTPQRCHPECGVYLLATQGESQSNQMPLLDMSRIEGAYSRREGAARFFVVTDTKVEMLRYFLRLVRTPDISNDLILDPFMLTGDVGVAAQAEGMNFVGYEVDSEKYTLACQRLSSLADE